MWLAKQIKQNTLEFYFENTYPLRFLHIFSCYFFFGGGGGVGGYVLFPSGSTDVPISYETLTAMFIIC